MDKTDRLSRTASVAYTKGLLNNPGENNCFLNSAVQVLWHLDVFRRSFRELSGHFCVGSSCIFCALKVIFTQFQYSDEAALPPDALRKALADTFKDQQRFQLQDMDDAAECLENILNRLHYHFAMNEKDEICSAAHCIAHRKFAMEIMEQTICNCGATSEPLPFFQLVHYVSVSALCNEAEILRSKMRALNQDNFGHLLKRAVNQGDPRNCPGNCGKRISVQQSLLNCPDVVCIGLIWDSDNPDIEQITQLLHCVDPILRLPEVFPRVSDDKARKVELLLAGVVTYYGKHYSTFFFSNKMKTWIYFDDARVRKCGPDWEKIRDKCCQNHYQPLLLLYVNPHGRAVSTKSAPTEVKLVDPETLLASGDSSWNKTKDLGGGSPLSDPKRKLKTAGSDDGPLSSSSTHSIGSERGSEQDLDMSEQKKRKRPIKRLRTIGSDIKRALSRSRNTSPVQELQDNNLHTLNNNNEPEKKSDSADDLINLREDPRRKPIIALYTQSREVDESDSGLGSGGSQASSPATSSVSSVDTNTEDLIDFNSKTSTRFPKDPLRVDSLIEEAEGLVKRSGECEKAGDLAMALSLCTQASSRIRMVIEKLTSTSHNPTYLTKLKNKYNFCVGRARDLHQKITLENEAKNRQFSQHEKDQLLSQQRERDPLIEEVEGLVKRSGECEKAGDIAMALSLCTQASSRIRMVIEKLTSTSHNPTYLTKLKNKYNFCVGRARDLHQKITLDNEAKNRQFSQHEKDQLLSQQRERDQGILRQSKQLAPSTYATISRSSMNDRDKLDGIVPMSSRSISEVYLRNDHDTSSATARGRTASRNHCSGNVGTSRRMQDIRDDVHCTQKIKPDILCYSPVHYGKPASTLSNDFDKLSVCSETSGRYPAVTHVATSFIPVRNSLPIEQTLLTSSAYVSPNSRTTDIRRCSIYDNLPPEEDRRGIGTQAVPPRPTLSSSYPNHPDMKRLMKEDNTERSRSWTSPAYVAPPSYGRPRTALQPGGRSAAAAGGGSIGNQPASLLQKFNVPSQSSETLAVAGRQLPEDVQRINKDIHNSRALCQRCRRTYVDKNAKICNPCRALGNMLQELDRDIY